VSSKTPTSSPESRRSKLDKRSRSGVPRHDRGTSFWRCCRSRFNYKSRGHCRPSERKSRDMGGRKSGAERTINAPPSRPGSSTHDRLTYGCRVKDPRKTHLPRINTTFAQRAELRRQSDLALQPLRSGARADLFLT